LNSFVEKISNSNIADDSPTQQEQIWGSSLNDELMSIEEYARLLNNHEEDMEEDRELVMNDANKVDYDDSLEKDDKDIYESSLLSLPHERIPKV
jgi:hypothetical protein